MRRVEGKVCFVSGAASGIGYATAERLVVEGATVILADRDKERLARTYEAVCNGSSPHRQVELDVTVEEDWKRVAADIDLAFGRLDVLVNNAGGGVAGMIGTATYEEWRSTITINLDSVFLGTTHLLPLLVRSGRGSIINISSIIGLVAARNNSAYGAAKAGVRYFTKSTALECADARNGVRANSIQPGQVETPLLMKSLADPTKYEAILSRIPLGRLGQPREIADAVVFLASDESSFMTGAELTLDGGYTAQ